MPKEETEEKRPIPAIEYSSQSSENSRSITAQPRQPRNLPDLLRYSTEAANILGEDASPSLLPPRSDESKKFLEAALKSVTVDLAEELLKNVKLIQNARLLPEDGHPFECEEALDNIFDLVDNVDVANDFHKIGGFCVFKPCLESSFSSLRWRGAELVAELCQNNPYCQEKVLETGLMPNLLRMVDMDEDDTVKVKALYAVSCLVRENEDGLKEFISSDGFSVLLRALQTDLQKLNIKSAFLLSSLCHWKPHIKDDLVNMGYVEQLITQLGAHTHMSNEDHPPSLEHLLSAILDILKDHSAAQEIARKPELQFKSLLDHLVKNSEGSDQFKEENDHAKSLIGIIFGKTENGNEER